MNKVSRNESFYKNAYGSRNLFQIFIKLYLSYDQLSKTRRNLAAVRNSLKSQESLSILDYGFGHGTLLWRIPRKHEVSGSELSSEAIRNVARAFRLIKRDISLYGKDEFLLPSFKKKYDLIFCSHVLEHVENDQALLDIFHNKLRDGGMLLLNVPINEVWRDPNHVRDYCVESIQFKLEKSGFTVHSVTEVDRWTAYILDKEYVSQALPRPVVRILRLILAPLPISILVGLENLLPDKYLVQQLIVVAGKT